VRSNTLKAVIVAALLAGNCMPAVATTFQQSVVVTGSAGPGDTTQVTYNIPANWHFIVVAVLPVVASILGNPASMNAAVDLASPWSAGQQMYAAQWTITADANGVAVNPAYQALSPFYLFSASSGQVHLRCSVGNMTGSCIYVTRMIPSGDPVF